MCHFPREKALIRVVGWLVGWFRKHFHSWSFLPFVKYPALLHKPRFLLSLLPTDEDGNGDVSKVV